MERIAPKVAAVVAADAGHLKAFLDACQQARSPPTDALAGEVLLRTKASDATRLRFLLDALDAERAVHQGMPAYRLLNGTFKLKVPMSVEGQYEIYPKACNELRTELYIRAAKSGPVAMGCRSLLATAECARRESGRPPEEFRHPLLEDGSAWTNVLAIRR